jgi:type II secretory pathway pseudopilin PulG
VSHPPARRSEGEVGYSLVALLASMTIMMVLMTAAVPSWRYVMQNDREEELLYRGGEIADAIVRFQKKNGNAYPTSLDQLVKGKFLRKLYKDPMTKDGKWRLVNQGQTIAPITPPGGSGGSRGGTTTTTTNTTTTTTLTGSPSSGTGPGGAGVLGPILGVASNSTEKSLRVFNGRTRYNEWIFAAGQPRVVGRAPTIGPGALPRGTGGGTSPPPTPGAR